jgi:hypothetical protein
MIRAFACPLVTITLACGCGDDAAMPTDGAVADTSTPDAAVDVQPPAKEGQVFIMESQTPVEIASAFAMLMDGPLLSPTATADGCLTMANAPAASLSAGAITITGTTEPLTLTQPSAGEVYVPDGDPPTNLFEPGATLTVAAAGDAVPAFTGTVVAPVPLADVVFPVALSRASSATVTWTADTAPAMWLLVNSATATEDAMLCRTTDTGSFTLTPAALALLPTPVTKVSIAIYRLDETMVAAGAWTIYLRAAELQSSTQLALGS